MFGRIGPLELLIIAAIILFIFGPKRLAGIGKSLGRTVSEFRKASKGEDDDQEEPKPAK